MSTHFFGMNEKITPLAETISIFFGAWVIASIWAGYFLTLELFPFILAVGAGAFYFHSRIHRQNEPRAPAPFMPWGTLALIGLLILFQGYVFLILQHGFDLSADVAPSLAAQLIQEKIPLTYAPYFNLPFIYQLGLPVLVAQLDWIPIPIHAWEWIFGLLGIILLMFFISLYFSTLMQNALAGLIAASAVFAMRLPFLNLLVGEYPLLFALGMGFAGICILRHSPKWGAVMMGAVAIIHPYVAVNIGIIWLVLERPDLKKMIETALIGLAAFIPVLVFQLIPFIISPKNVSTETGGLALRTLLAFPFLAGVLLCMVGFILFAVILSKKKGFSSPLKRTGILIAIGFLGFVIGNFFPNLSVASKLVEITSIGLAGFVSIGLISVSKKRNELIAAALILIILGTASFVFSSSFQKFTIGSKISIREAKFAEWWGEQNPELAPTFFAAKGAEKMAFYSHKIPLTITQAYIISRVVLQLKNPEVDRILFYEEQYSQLMKTHCTSCALDFPVKYLVVDTTIFPRLDATPLWEKDSFVVYAGKLYRA